MWRGILALVLVIAAIIWAQQFSQARQDINGKSSTDRSRDMSRRNPGSQHTAVPDPQEVEICRGKDSFTYEVDGKRYALPFEVIDDQAIVERDIVFAPAADVLNRGANRVSLVVPDYVRGEPKRCDGNLLPYVSSTLPPWPPTASRFSRR